jgi:hypothetical protein
MQNASWQVTQAHNKTSGGNAAPSIVVLKVKGIAGLLHEDFKYGPSGTKQVNSSRSSDLHRFVWFGQADSDTFVIQLLL